MTDGGGAAADEAGVPTRPGVPDAATPARPAGHPRHARHARPAERTRAEAWFAPALGLLTLAGLLWRFAYLHLSGADDTSTFNQGDAFWYSSVATTLARGNGFINPFSGVPTADHPPLTVLLLTPTSWLFDGSTYAQRLTMVLIGAATIAVIGLAGRRLGGARVGLVAAALAAALPALWINDVLLMSETPTAFLVAVILYLAIRLAETPTLRLGLVAGAVCGLSALARAETGLFLPLLVWPALALARDVEWRARAGRIAAASAATALVMAPWFLFNVDRFDEPVFISTNDGLTLLGANCDATYSGSITGGWLLQPCVQDFWDTMDDRKAPGPASFPADDPCPDRDQQRPPCWDASTVSGLMRAEGVSYLRGHVSDLPKVIYARHGRVWGWYRLDQSIGTGGFEGRAQWASRLGFQVTWVLLPVSAVGAVLLRRRRVSLLPFASSLIIVVVVTTAFYGLVRFRTPWDVASCLVGAVAISAAVDRWGPGRRTAGDGPSSPAVPSDATPAA